MELLHERCAALDIGKKDLKACVRTPSPKGKRSRRQEIRTFATTTNALLELRDWLVGERVSLVVMEATGDYWRGAFYLLEDDLEVILVNAAHAKGLPGRKTDVCDASWLCQMGECGLLRASFVPPEPIRQLRDLTRYRTTLATERTREAQRLEKELEDAGIKLSSVATDILGVSGRAMLAALIDGERDAQVLAEMAKARMRPKIPQLVQALTGNFGDHHAFLCRLHLERIDQLTAAIGELSARIEEQMRPFSHQLDQLATIPGVGRAVAEVIVAETGADMSRFPTPDTWPPGPGCARATTNRRANVDPARPVTATGGCAARWAPPPWPRPEPATPPTSVPDTDDSPHAWARRKPSSPSSTRFSPRPGTCSPTTSTTTTSAATTSRDSTPNAPCAASSDKPTPSATPSGSTPSTPPDHPHDFGTAPETSITPAAATHHRFSGQPPVPPGDASQA